MQVQLQLIPVCGDRYLQLFLAQNQAEYWLTLFQIQVVTTSVTITPFSHPDSTPFLRRPPTSISARKIQAIFDEFDLY
ncbi:hypothetical protein NNRS527_00421 [Nitrosospira sp. NRS527]|nr:hypothetical protein NNRS527_00421 [Nitrosospira sp. NRS527]